MGLIFFNQITSYPSVIYSDSQDVKAVKTAVTQAPSPSLAYSDGQKKVIKLKLGE